MMCDFGSPANSIAFRDKFNTLTSLLLIEKRSYENLRLRHGFESLEKTLIFTRQRAMVCLKWVQVTCWTHRFGHTMRIHKWATFRTHPDTKFLEFGEEQLKTIIVDKTDWLLTSASAAERMRTIDRKANSIVILDTSTIMNCYC